MLYHVGGNMRDVVIANKRESSHYYYFNKTNGLSIRAEHKGFPEPFWAKEGPELLDISITNYCEKGCSFCYRNSNINGKHINFKNYVSILDQLEVTHTYQIALGGGNPNQHPDFVKILEVTRLGYGIVPSYTTNGMGLTDEIIEASRKYCGAVAVSYYEPLDKFVYAVRKLINAGIKTNIHYLLTSKSVDEAIDLLLNQPEYLNGLNAIVFLNYKPVGENKSDDLLFKKSNRVSDFFDAVRNHDLRKFKIGFDSCTVSGIVNHLNFNSNFIESCESGRFSAFISEDMMLYPCSFMEANGNGVDLSRITLIEAWKNSDIFLSLREQMSNNNCISKCKYEDLCMGGCPLYNKINLCKVFIDE